MKQIVYFLLIGLFVVSCEKKELQFENIAYEKQSKKPCDSTCTQVKINVPIAENSPVVEDSINNAVFNTVREIVYFGEQPYTASNYQELMENFVKSYNDLIAQFPNDKMPAWEATVEGKVVYHSENIINITLKHYTFTGGAHGYSGVRSIVLNAETGKTIPEEGFIKDKKGFQAYAEKKFREKFNIPAGKPINENGLMFENEVFQLPETYIFSEKGLVLYYNTYEIAPYVDGPRELLLPYDSIKPYLILK
ncbi:DUF3298 and DUF4163 domain-containing protein [Flavobacterium sp.]|uniref:DUF3298 and DUF4163 domain-containing protein n=1 Tax=Flavobacterium sp. TaxID=239 RepID=UPI00260B61C7|nr:DUF3298 and DUF4163 domain-containing protein [Flavobacterium sp.]